MPPYVISTDIVFNIDKLRQDMCLIQGLANFDTADRQISIKYNPSIEGQSLHEMYYDGTGSTIDHTGAIRYHERDYTQLHPCFVDSYTGGVISAIEYWFKVKIGRARYMNMKRRFCYSWHRDYDDLRFHIPLQTQTGCFIIVEDQLYTMPDVGRVYELHTKQYHTAVNASDQERIHLVLNTI